MDKSKLKVVGGLVFILIFTFTMTACDMVGNNTVEDTSRDVADSSESGDVVIEISGIEMKEEVGAQNVHYNNFQDFEIELELVSQDDPDIKYNEKVNLDADEDILIDGFNDNYSVTFTGLKEGKYNVRTALNCHTINTNEKVTLATRENYEVTVIAGMKIDVAFALEQTTGGLDITVDQFPSEATGGEIMEDVNVKLLDLDGETVLGEMDFNYGVEDENLLVEGLYPAYYTMVISWDGHGSVREEVQVRVIPDQIKLVPINLFGSQIIVDADWVAEPASPENITVEQNDNGFLISWDGVDNADSYNILRKRTPYFHDDFAKVGEIVDTGEASYEFQYDVEKPELFDIATYEFQIVAIREHEGFDLTSEPANGEFIDLGDEN